MTEKVSPAVLARFMDGEGRVTQLPRRQAVRRALLEYLAGKFELDTEYTEGQVNEICTRWHTFNDFYMVRRLLVDDRLLARERDGSRYWRLMPPDAGEG